MAIDRNALPVNVDASYPDTGDPSRALHQQAHDAIHAAVRDDTTPFSHRLTRTAVKTTNYTAAVGDLVPCDTTSAAFTVTLPSAPAVGSRVAVKLVTLGAGHAVTVACGGSDVFNKTAGATTASLTLLNQAIQVQYDTGGIWTVVADDIPKSQLDATYAPLASPALTGTPTVNGATVEDRTHASATYAPLLVPLYAKRGSQPRSDVRWLTSFQAGHGWTTGGTVTTFTDDPAVFSLGTQSVKVTLGTASANGWINKTGMAAMDLTGKVIVVRLRVEDLSLISQIEVDIGDTAFANRYVMTRWTSTVFAAVNQQWVDVMFDISEASVTGAPNRAAITDVKFRFFSNGTATSGNPLTIHVQSVGFLSSLAAAYPNGVVTFSFDDGFASQYTAGKSYLDKYGYAGTLYTIVERLGQSGFMTNAQVQSAHYDSGWEIAGHAYTAAAHDNRLTSLSTADLQTEMANLKQWLVTNGFPSESFAYPGGVFNTADATVMQTVAQFFSTARTTVNNPLYNVAPPLVPMLTSQRDMATGTTNLATQLTVVGTEKLWLNFMCHGIDTGTVVSCTSAVFQAVVDQVAATSVAVATVDDVIRKTR